MKSFSFLIYLFFFTIISPILCAKQQILVTTEIQSMTIESTSWNAEFNVSISPECTENFKFIKIIAVPIERQALLYLSKTNNYPNSRSFDLSAIETGTNQIYVPRTFFETSESKFFYMNANCVQVGCNFNISFQLVEMMYAEKAVRLGFLTFDYEEYLIKFDKNAENEKSQLMVTASGGAKGHHGSRNNVKLTLYYIDTDNNNITQIDIDSDTMFNGAGTTFKEQSYTQPGNGYYLARVRGPTNTYINFMVREIGISCDLPIDGKAIYGYLQGDDIDTFELSGYASQAQNQQIQISIVVKGDLIISKSSDELCDPESEDTESQIVRDELQAILTITGEEISKGITHICIQGENVRTKTNAFIIEVHDVTDQKISTIVTEPLVNGYLYIDYLKYQEVRSYRHSKYLETGLTKYNCKLDEGIIKVALIECPSFPNCMLSESIINWGSQQIGIYSTILTSIDNYYTTNVNKSLETNAYGPKQYLLAVLCLSEKCKYEVSFSDEEDSLILREDSRIGHFISPDSTNYYHFKIADVDKASKVFVYLRTISGDSNIDVIGDVTERKRYYMENTKILEFYGYEYTGLYTLNVSGSIGSFYLLSYSVLREGETEEDKIFDIGLGVSIIDGIKQGNTKKKFQMFHDKTRGSNLAYIATFYAINCNIGVKFFDKEVKSINGIFQRVIKPDGDDKDHYNEDYFQYEVRVINFIDDSSYDNNFCLFHITAQEISSQSESIVSEGTSISFALTNETESISFIYPHSAGESEILIKYNLENSYLVHMEIKIDGTIQTGVLFSRSSSHIISANDIRNYCKDVEHVCGIYIGFKQHESSKNMTIPINFIIKSKDNTPATLSKNKLQVDLVADNNIQYYLVDLNPVDKGEVVLNFKKGSGIMFAKIVGKDADPEENADWNYRVRLPKPNEKEDSVGEFDRYKNNIKYDASILYKYGIPVCQNGCELYIGVISTDVIKNSENQNDYLEYSIYVRPELDTSSTDPDEHQKLINKVMIDLLANEYVIGYIESSSDIHYYFFDVQDDCDFIEIEFQSESCSLYINNGTNYPDPGNSRWEINSKISSSILTIEKKDVGDVNLKGKEFRMAVNSKKYDELMSMMYIFRIRVIKRSSKSVIEINGNLATVCDIKNASEYCDLLYPLSDYEYNMGSNLFIYAEPDVITDIDIYFNPVISHDFDKLTPEEMDKKLPRPENSKKSIKSQNYMEITMDDLVDVGGVKSYALISIRSSKPSVINIYTTMREQVKTTSLNPYSKLLFQRDKGDIIYFNTKGDQAYNFYITCINGEAKAYFDSEKEDQDKYKIITGSGSQFSLSLPQKKEDILIIEPTSDSGIIFYINENIHPEVRQMELIKFGFSGRIVYDETNELNLPVIYYMKIQDEGESINLNLHINNLITNFNPIDGGNYTEVFDISGWIVDENMLASMMRSKRKNPPKEEAVIGRYDKSLTTAKLYFSSEQIKNKGEDNIKYLVISLDKNERMDTNIQSMTMHISAMPFSNILYSSPYNLYIAGNLLKNNSASSSNYHRLRVGNQGDAHMQIEIGILSKNVHYSIKDINNNTINYEEKMTFKNGKYKGVIGLQSNNDLYIEFYRDKVEIAHEASLNYIFKVKSNSENYFTNYILNSNKVEYKFNHDQSQSWLDLKIPKVLSRIDSKAVPAVYYIRLYPKDAFDSKDDPNTICFISYYAFATYIYKISEGDDVDNEPINTKISNFPEDKAYIVSIIVVTSDEEKEEIFAYEPIVDPYNYEKEEERDKTYIIILSVSIAVVFIVIVIVIYFIVRMMKKRKTLEEEISRTSKLVSSYSIGPNQEPK